MSYNFSFLPSAYKPLLWEKEEPVQVFDNCKKFLQALKKIQTDPEAKELFNQSRIRYASTFLYFSGQIENTGLPLSDTYELCVKVFGNNFIEESDLNVEESQLATPTDVAYSRSRKETLQHAAAYCYLQEKLVQKNQDLTVDHIKRAHLILMNGLKREDGEDSMPGEYRLDSVSAGSHQFPPYQYVTSLIDLLVIKYNKRRLEENVDPFRLAAWLSYEFVTIHLFLDGNGRLSRLLLNMALLQNGIPFPVALGFSSGHKKAKKHYMVAIYDARKKKGNTMILNSILLHAFRDVSVSFSKDLRDSFPEKYPNYLENALI